MRSKKIYLIYCLTTFFLLNHYLALPLIAITVEAKAAIVVDEKTGKIWYAKDEQKVLPIASLSKMLSQYLILEAVSKQEITWDTLIPINEKVAELSRNKQLSNIPLNKNKKYRLQELFEAVSLFSANAALISIVEFMAGSEDAWLSRMNNKLSSFGITDAKLINATGLPYFYNLNKNNYIAPDAENSMSVQSLAIIARRLVLDFPEIIELTGQATKVEYYPLPKKKGKILLKNTKKRIKKIRENTNLLLPGLKYGRKGVSGLKTGTSSKGGYSLAVRASEGDITLISIIVGANSHSRRFTESNSLLDEVFGTIKEYQSTIEGRENEISFFIPSCKEILPIISWKTQVKNFGRYIWFLNTQVIPLFCL